MYSVHVDIFTKRKESNLRQRRWIKLHKNHDIDILYHPRKVNFMADALSQKSIRSKQHNLPKRQGKYSKLITKVRKSG